MDTERPSASYQYKPLDTTKQQIRLLKLHRLPPTFAALLHTDAVHCEIETFDIDTAPAYIALSYTWGDPAYSRIIYLDNRPFRVRTNLFDFLCAFRSDNANIYYLWIDQLCIDQTTTEERSHQVRLMSQIYTRCQFVIASLGLATAGLARAFLESPSSDLVRQLLQDRYFTRLWIVQEIRLAPQVRILCGQDWISWTSISSIVNIRGFFRQPNLSLIIVRPISSAGALFALRRHGPHALIGKFASMQCEDPRDKVYGLLGLVDERSRPMVDYNKPLYEVYIDTVRAFSQDCPFTSEAVMMYLDLAWDMEFPEQTLCVLQEHFKYIGKIDERMRQKRHFSTLQMGYETGLPSQEALDRWWLEADGQRLYYTCDPTSGQR
ncbi:HET-domain-containing protein [Decorospora gaudefroyi]|uniref:HET-domain-containing protein n=1 Tax=Decorospora gaudefroyi TaxID=184978 RepID=A0A6A5K7C4_9PLEO|nr:HET-domain-containing protein [Decorospora gaudefroyi]